MNKCLSALACFALVVSSACEKGSPLAPPTPSPSPTPTSFSFFQFTGGMEVLASLLPPWALRGENCELCVKQMVFADNEAGLNNPGLTDLAQFGLSSITVSYPPEFEPYKAHLLDGKAEWERLGIPMVFQDAGSQANLKLVVDSAVGGAEVRRTFDSSGNIIGGTIAFKNLVDFVNYHNFVHELSHVAGFYHYTGCGVSSQKACPGDSRIRFAQAEIDNFHLKQKLPSGTSWPKSANSTTSFSTQKLTKVNRIEVVVCNLDHRSPG